MILVSLITQIIVLLILPIAVSKTVGLSGFILSCFIILLLGLTNAVLLSSIFALISFLPFEYMIAMSLGQALSGILMNIIRYFVTISIDSGKKLSKEETDYNAFLTGFIFFSSAAFLMIVNIVFLMVRRVY